MDRKNSDVEDEVVDMEPSEKMLLLSLGVENPEEEGDGAKDEAANVVERA